MRPFGAASVSAFGPLRWVGAKPNNQRAAKRRYEESAKAAEMHEKFDAVVASVDDFKSVTRDLTLPAHTLDARTIRRAAGECLKRVDLTRRLRLLGVRAGALARLRDLVAPLAPEPAAAPRAEEPSAHYGLPLFDLHGAD